MVAETGEEWPSKLQATVLAANTGWKNSTKYTSFFLMYGREANCAHLLEHNKIEESEPQQPSDYNAPPTDDQDDWVDKLMDIRYLLEKLLMTTSETNNCYKNEHLISK